MATIFYYPEGPSGPVCDIVVDDAAAERLAQRLKELSELGDGREPIYTPTDWESMENVMGPVTAIFVRRCRVRTLSDGTKEYYDCVDDLINPIGEFSGYPLQAPLYDWEANSISPWGLDDNFEPAELNEKACNPHDPDINIFPVKFYRADGSFVTKILVEKSSPVTFPVTSGGASVSNPSISASFANVAGVLSLVVTGSGTGVVTLNMTWRDDPDAFGVAVGSLSVGGITLNQVGYRGSAGATISVTAGTNYPITTANNYPRDIISPNEICFKDDDGNDCNVRLKIGSASSEEPVLNDTGYWSDEANTYAVWVNPEICTLPNQQQQVTYFIDIPSTDTYTIVGAADDYFDVYLNDSPTPIIGGVGGIFSGGSLTTPYSATTTLNQGTLKMVVSCTNSDAGFNTNGQPSGLAYSWQRNPGGWYVKICKGTGCIASNAVTWVKAGPHPGWAAFMDTYAVYPSNTEVLKGVDHTTDWNINVPYAGDYEFEYAVDNTGSWSLDGTQIASAVDNFGGSGTYTITNLSSGPHTITAVVNNNAGDADDWAKNPAGTAWTLRPLATSNAAFASFNQNGDLVVTGNGTAQIQLNFDWDDNPNTAGTALNTLKWFGLDGVEFVQSGNSGSDSATATVIGGTTYQMNLQGSGGGFEIRNNGNRICFFDNDGDDCNANVEISQTTQSTTQPDIIASSLGAGNSSNLIWHTRMDTGYKFVQTSSSYGTT